MGSLITHELTMQHRTDDDLKRKKSIVFKTAIETNEESKDEHSSDINIEDEDLAMIVRRFKKIMGKNKRFNKKFPKQHKTFANRKKESHSPWNRKEVMIMNRLNPPTSMVV